MAEDVKVADPVVEPVEEPKAPEQKSETKEEKKDTKPQLDPKRPLSQQVDKIMANMPEEEEKKDDEPAKSEEKSEEEEKAPETETQADEPEEEEEPEASRVEPVEGTWQDYVLKNLTSFQVHILDAAGKPKTLTIKTPQELPEGYSWPNAVAQDAFHIAVKAQDDKAKELLGEFNQKQQQAQFEEFQAVEAQDIQSDIQALQKEGLLEKFKYSEDDPKFNDDPAVKEANAIYDIYKKTNEGYMKKYAGSSRTFRISYRDAADKYFAQKARAPKDTNPQKEERDKVASKVSAPSSANPDQVKRTLPPGSTMQDVLKLYKLGALK